MSFTLPFCVGFLQFSHCRRHFDFEMYFAYSTHEAKKGEHRSEFLSRTVILTDHAKFDVLFSFAFGCHCSGFDVPLVTTKMTDEKRDLEE